MAPLIIVAVIVLVIWAVAKEPPWWLFAIAAFFTGVMLGMLEE